MNARVWRTVGSGAAATMLAACLAAGAFAAEPDARYWRLAEIDAA